jgi:hypothetical protein
LISQTPFHTKSSYTLFPFRNQALIYLNKDTKKNNTANYCFTK